MKRHTQLLLALVLGSVLGILLHGNTNEALIWTQENIFYVVGQIFLRLIFMVVVPLILSALILAVFELVQEQGLGKVVGKTILYTIVASSCAVIIGITLVNLIKPGAGLQIPQELLQQNSGAISKIQSNAAQSKTIAQMIVDLFTRNPVETAVKALDGEIIPFMIFALLFGIALANSQKNNPNSVMKSFFEEVLAASQRMVEFAMALAPYAVFCLVFQSAFRFGHEIFKALLMYVCVAVLGFLIQQFVVYSALLKWVAKYPPLQFLKDCREVLLYAFSTASSNATLPKTLDTAERKLKLPAKVSRFVLTVGATANQNGTALFEGVTVLFLAQVYGIDLSLSQQLVVVLVSILAGIGTAGVPGGSLPAIVLLLQSVGIPAEGIGLILGVDRFLDMCRTTLNVSGDLVIATLVADRRQS